MKIYQVVPAVMLVMGMSSAHAVQTAGAALQVQATGEVVAANDQAQLVFVVEEQDKDKAVAASRVNQRMNRGIALLKKADATASLKTQGYYTYPVYSEAQPQAGKARVIVAWQVGQRLSMTTNHLTALPQMVASVQNTLALNGVQFGLSPALQKKQDAALLTNAYANLAERAGFIAQAMGRRQEDVLLEEVDVGTQDGGGRMPVMMSARADMAKGAVQVEEPSFEPGETTLSIGVSGKFRLK